MFSLIFQALFQAAPAPWRDCLFIMAVVLSSGCSCEGSRSPLPVHLEKMPQADSTLPQKQETISASHDKAEPKLRDTVPWLNADGRPQLPARGPLSILLESTPSFSGSAARLGPLGWTEDGQRFGYCLGSDDEFGESCAFVDRAGRQTDYSNVDTDEVATPELTAQLAQLKAQITDVAGTTWPFGDAMRLSLQINHAGRTHFELHAHLEGEAKPVLLERIPAPGPSNIPRVELRPAVVRLSPDGEFLALLGHASWGEFTDTFAARIWSTRALGASAYNSAGMQHHAAGRYRRAARLFYKATLADENGARAPYNLACAAARLNMPRVSRELLQLSVERGGVDVLVKARADPDLASLREAPGSER